MLFNSFEFIFLFLPITIITFFLAAKFRYTKFSIGFLVVASLFFYAYWDIRYLPLLLVSILFNYFCGKAILKFCKYKKAILILAIVVDLALLGYFKYTNFIIYTINDIFQLSMPLLDIILPLGISFFTFTQLAFLVDAYRGDVKKFDLLSYSLFVTIFPHLIAGPIIHHSNIIPQFYNLRTFVFNQRNFAVGVLFFVIGLAKKVMIADALSPWVKIAFNNPSALTFVDAWLGALSYTFQLYYDFSGYSEMAVGLGLMMNITLPINFNSPYKATSIKEFWKRWHITLSDFLKNYIYIPLGGNRSGYGNQMKNLMVTMLIGGLWHGAAWNFVIWGGLHGAYLLLNHTLSQKVRLPVCLSWTITFIAVVFAWVFFRAASVSDAIIIIKAMLGLKGFAWKNLIVENRNTELVVIIMLLVAIKISNTQSFVKDRKPSFFLAISIAVLFILCILKLNEVSEFLYFQF